MMTHTPTAEQQLILDAARTTEDNIIVHALAGAAKTSTLVMIGNAIRNTPMLCLAFNVKIKDEMKERMPGNCEVMTLNSIGHRTWSQAIGRRLIISKDKTYQICKGLIEELKGEDKSLGYDIFSDLIKAVDQGKIMGYIPTGKFPMAKPLLNDEEFFATLEEEPSALMEHLLRKATFESIAQAMQGNLDYNDQILMPTVFHGRFPQYPITLGDEVQDWSELNHVMLRKIVRNKRVIGVGDENQSIYGFRGAHQDSMSLLQQTFSMKRFDLSISFRCPRAVVAEARTRAPSMMWPDWAIEGQVVTLPEWKIEDLPNDCTILCRNNAPLFSMAIKLLKNGRFPTLQGNDIGKKLTKIMAKLGPRDTPAQQVHVLIDEWVEAKLKKSRSPGSVHDQADCMRVFVEQTDTLADAIAYANHLMTISGNIRMMTCHKSKGLEWDTVFLLDRQLIRVEKHTQERNLLYVAQTRAKQSLYYITSDGFRGV